VVVASLSLFSKCTGYKSHALDSLPHGCRVPHPPAQDLLPRSRAHTRSRARTARSVRYHTYVSTLLKNGAHGVSPHARSSATPSLVPGTACA